MPETVPFKPQVERRARLPSFSLILASLMFGCSLLLLGWAIFPQLPRQVMWYLRERSLQRQQAEMQRLLARDPKPAQVMPAFPQDIQARPLAPAARRNILFIGAVRPSSRDLLLLWLQQETSDTSAKWVVVGIGKKEDLLKIQQAAEGRFQVVWDADGRLHNEWNAVILPRVYEVDAKWRLKAVRRPTGGCTEGCGGCGGG